MDYTILDFSRFLKVKSIEIGDDCLASVQTFKIDGLNHLKTIKIGKNSFTQMKSEHDREYEKKKKKSKSFHILNCESLESIQIGEFSFSDFGGDFELKNLPQLQSIQIGTVKELWSDNFYCSSLVIRGKKWYDIELWIWIDLPNLQSISLGGCVFKNSLSTIIESIECTWMKWLM